MGSFKLLQHYKLITFIERQTTQHLANMDVAVTVTLAVKVLAAVVRSAAQAANVSVTIVETLTTSCTENHCEHGTLKRLSNHEIIATGFENGWALFFDGKTIYLV